MYGGWQKEWRFGAGDRFDLIQFDCMSHIMLLDYVASERDPGAPDGDPYCAFVGLYDSRKAARKVARRIMRDDPGVPAAYHAL
jgi:hypothetical protein